MTLPLLTILGVIPLVGALVLLALPKGNARLIKQVALAFSIAALVFTVFMGLQFDADSTAAFQFVESYPWIYSVRGSEGCRYYHCALC